MLYALLCYNSEDAVMSWTKEEDDAVMARLDVVHERLKREGKFGPALRLMPTTAATTLNKSDGVVLDGPFAETKEQLLGFYVVDVEDLDEAIAIARELAEANPGGAYEMRPVGSSAGRGCRLSDPDWIDAALLGARPQAVAALLRYFRDLDLAEEAFQEACLRALKTWPKNGPPRDAAAWLIMVGRNAGIDQTRRTRRQTALPDEDGFPTSTTPSRRWPSASTPPTIATTSCGCSSSAAIRTCRPPSRSRWRSGSSPASPSSRSRAPSSSASARWSSGSPGPRRASPRRAFPSRRPDRWSAPRGSAASPR